MAAPAVPMLTAGRALGSGTLQRRQKQPQLAVPGRLGVAGAVGLGCKGFGFASRHEEYCAQWLLSKARARLQKVSTELQVDHVFGGRRRLVPLRTGGRLAALGASSACRHIERDWAVSLPLKRTPDASSDTTKGAPHITPAPGRACTSPQLTTGHFLSDGGTGSGMRGWATCSSCSSLQQQ